MNIKKKREMHKLKLLEIEHKLGELTEALEFIKPETEKQEAIILENEASIEKMNKEHLELLAKQKYLENASLNSNEYFTVSENVKTSIEMMDSYQSSIADAQNHIKAIKDANVATFTELEIFTNQKKKLIKDIKAQELNINSKSSQVDPIIESLVKALMSRKKLMEKEK